MADRRIWYIIELHLANLLLSANILFSRFIDQPAPVIVFGRTFIAFFVLLTFLILRKETVLPDRKNVINITLSGLFLSGHWVLLFYSAQLSTIAIAILTLYTFPIITVLLEPFFIGGRLKSRDIILGLAVIPGITLVSSDLSFARDGYGMGVLIGLLSAFLLAIRNLWIHRTLSHYSGSSIMIHQVFIVFLSLIPLMYFFDLSFTGKDLTLIVLLGTVFTAFAHTLLVRAIMVMKVKTASIVSGAQPFYAIMLAFFFFQEIPTLTVLIGGFIIVSVSMIESIYYRREDNPEVQADLPGPVLNSGNRP